MKRILTNSAFKGVTVYGKTRVIALVGNRRKVEERSPEHWIEIPGVTPPIVTGGLFDIVQEVLSHPKRNPKLSSRKYLLTSFIECTCGAPVVGSCLSKSYRYYRCRSTFPTTTRPKTCDSHYMKADGLEESVWNAVSEVLRQPELIVEQLERQKGGSSLLEEEMARCRTSIQRLADQEKRLIRLFGIGQITEEFLLRDVEQLRSPRNCQGESRGSGRRRAESLPDCGSLPSKSFPSDQWRRRFESFPCR